MGARSVVQLDVPRWIRRHCSWLEVGRLGGAMHGILSHLEWWYHLLLHNICLEMKIQCICCVNNQHDVHLYNAVLSCHNVQWLLVLFSLKMPGFLASMVCSNSGASPSGSSLPRLSFSSLETHMEKVQRYYKLVGTK